MLGHMCLCVSGVCVFVLHMCLCSNTHIHMYVIITSINEWKLLNFVFANDKFQVYAYVVIATATVVAVSITVVAVTYLFQF